MSLMGTRKWPYLASLFGGYLHQDFTAEHGSAPRAVQAWLTEAEPTRRGNCRQSGGASST